MKRSKRDLELACSPQVDPKTQVIVDALAASSKDKLQGNGVSYTRLCSSFAKILERNSGDDLFHWFSAFSRVGNTISFQHQTELMDLLLSFSWYAPKSRHADVLAAYSDAVVQCVAGSKGIIGRVYRALTQQIRCKKSAVGQPDMRLTKDTVLALHSCLRRLLNVLPTSGAVLCQALEASYPTKYEDRHDHLVYLEMLLLDADIDMERVVAKDELTFSFEVDDKDSFVRERIKEERLKAESIDGMLEKMFDYVDSYHLEMVVCASTQPTLASLPAEFSKQSDFFRSLLHVFNARVLASPSAQFVQYLVFYACAKNPLVLGPVFLSYLMGVFLDYSLDFQVRASAAGYVGSFVARFARLPSESIQSAIGTLGEWTVTYIERHTAHGSLALVPDLKTHYLFYAVCNAIFYMLCFRPSHAPPNMKVLMRKVLDSPLNPLLFLQPGVVEEVVAIGLEDILDVDFIRRRVNENKPLKIAGVGFTVTYPFDPCLLSKAELRVRAHYNAWEAADEGRDEEEDDEGDCMAMSVGTPIITAGVSFGELDLDIQSDLHSSSGPSSLGVF